MKIGSCVLVAMTDNQAISSLENFSAFEKNASGYFQGRGRQLGELRREANTFVSNDNFMKSH